MQEAINGDLFATCAQISAVTLIVLGVEVAALRVVAAWKAAKLEVQLLGFSLDVGYEPRGCLLQLLARLLLITTLAIPTLSVILAIIGLAWEVKQLEPIVAVLSILAVAVVSLFLLVQIYRAGKEQPRGTRAEN